MRKIGFFPNKFQTLRQPLAHHLLLHSILGNVILYTGDLVSTLLLSPTPQTTSSPRFALPLKSYISRRLRMTTIFHHFQLCFSQLLLQLLRQLLLRYPNETQNFYQFLLSLLFFPFFNLDSKVQCFNCQYLQLQPWMTPSVCLL